MDLLFRFGAAFNFEFLVVHEFGKFVVTKGEKNYFKHLISSYKLIKTKTFFIITLFLEENQLITRRGNDS